MVKIKKNMGEGIKRVPTGFPKLDEMLQGGLPQNTVTLLSGACGTGKSTFAMQFLYHGAKYNDEPGVYVTLEENADTLVNNMSLFGWELEELIKQKKLIVVKPEVYKFDSLKQIIADSIDKIGAKRLVVDSYSVLLTYFSDPDQVRNGLVQLDREIKKMGCTAIVISDIQENSSGAEMFSTTGVEEFIVDGVIVLRLIRDIAHPYVSKRAIAVRKMRATRHPLSLHHFSITESGIQVGDPIEGKDELPIRSRPRKKKPKRVQKPKPPMPSKSTTIQISDLRRKGSHSWKWKHL